MSRRSKIAATVAAGAALGVLAVRASDVAGWVRQLAGTVSRRNGHAQQAASGEAQQRLHGEALPFGPSNPAVSFPDSELIRACVHCGLCLPYCPTYNVLGLEADSPRGRIYQMKLVTEGTVSPEDPHFSKHIYQCLDCRACETACPSGVQYGRLVEAARSIIPPRNAAEQTGRRLFFGGFLSSPRLLDAVGIGSRLYQRSGLQTLVRGSGLLRVVPPLKRTEEMLPTLQGSLVEKPLPPIVRAEGERKRIVAFLSGCIAARFFPETNRSTVAVLAAYGCDVLTPPDQRCCGALANHSGDRETALAMARHNVDVFDRTGAEYIVVNAAGCGSMLKEYGVLLADDPAYAERARAFSARVRDITELLAELPLKPPTHTVRRKVTYQDACHLAHGQKVRVQPRELLKSVPGLELAEMYHSDWCCGSAGTYNVTQPELSEQILARKMDNVAATGADTVIASNPGCLIQLEKGIRDRGLKMRVAHPVDLLAEGYGLKT
ncbi:MAG TPA: heterodisulfide reductase-related iron-sulfur binding cluster [Chloroflexota bacterium]|nr:heterodisulfide reductase-related iron-sulfur binding cluster [Chloroflexota bacterium]